MNILIVWTAGAHIRPRARPRAHGRGTRGDYDEWGAMGCTGWGYEVLRAPWPRGGGAGLGERAVRCGSLDGCVEVGRQRRKPGGIPSPRLRPRGSGEGGGVQRCA